MPNTTNLPLRTIRASSLAELAEGSAEDIIEAADEGHEVGQKPSEIANEDSQDMGSVEQKHLGYKTSIDRPVVKSWSVGEMTTINSHGLDQLPDHSSVSRKSWSDRQDDNAHLAWSRHNVVRPFMLVERLANSRVL